ncbi:hypothetical protein [Kitasatospora sp. NPDC004289]
MPRSRRRQPPPSAPRPPGRRFRRADHVVVLVVVLVLASGLALAGVPTLTVLELLTGAGGVAMGLAQYRPAYARPRHRPR